MTNSLFVVITVDTEDSQRSAVVYDDAVQEIDTMIYGNIGLEGEYYGFQKIMDICDEVPCKATFFVSVFDCRKYGETSLANVCKAIKDRGHDVQLHTHPRRAYDKSRRELYKYSIDEQTRLMDEGRRLIKDWTGTYPVAHRAGTYALNDDTIYALRTNKIAIDSSMFFKRPECKLCWSRNKVVFKSGVLEIPVTGFFRETNLTLASIPVFRRRQFTKTDVDWTSLDELLAFVNDALKYDIRVLNLFMHSYSFIKFSESFTDFKPDYDDMTKFDRFLKVISINPRIKIVTMTDLFNIYLEDPNCLLNGSDYVPVYRKRAKAVDTIKTVLKRKWHNYL